MTSSKVPTLRRVAAGGDEEHRHGRADRRDGEQPRDQIRVGAGGLGQRAAERIAGPDARPSGETVAGFGVTSS